MIIEKDFPYYDLHSHCFSCGNRFVTDQAKVMWNGHDSYEESQSIEITLHAECAGLLALHLSSDALEADLKNGRHLFNHPRHAKGFP